MSPEQLKLFADLKQTVDKLNDLFYRINQNDKFFLNKKLVIRNGNIEFEGPDGAKIGKTTDKLGFFGVTPIVKPTAITADLTAVTATAPGTPDYAIQDFTQTTPWGFASHDEANTVLKVLINVQLRVKDLETKLKALGLLT